MEMLDCAAHGGTEEFDAVVTAEGGMTLDAVIWIICIGFPVAALIFLNGWMVGFNSAANWSNWGTGYDDGWKAHKEFAEATFGENEQNKEED